MRRLAGGLLLLLHAGCCDDPGARGPGTRLGEAWRPGVDAVERSLLFYVKLPKCASSTTGGVARRVAARHGLVGARKTGKHHCPPPETSAVPCGPFRNGQQVWASHMKLREAILHVPSPLERRVFLFTVVREPLARAVSNYLHFGVTRKHKPHNDSDIGAYLLGIHDPLFSYASPEAHDAPARLLATYDLVGTVELYDETMTLLAARLGVPLTDVLYVSAKNASARGAAEQGERHVAAGAAQLARVRAAYGADFERHQTKDYALWRGATALVEAAVDRGALARYRALKAFAADPCGADPASFTEAQCLWKDNGCGQACLDDRAGEYEKRFRPVLTVPAAS